MSKGQSFIKVKPMPAWCYVLRLKSGKLYIGATTDLKLRYQDHLSGKACQTTKFDPPVGLAYSETFEFFSEARKREAQVKRWSRAKKEALISGNHGRLHEFAKSREYSFMQKISKPW
jgi:putative endonuclease